MSHWKSPQTITDVGAGSKRTWRELICRAGGIIRVGNVWADLAVSALVGALYALYLVGPAPLNPTNINWLKGDAITYYTGWSLFRQDPHWHLPLTWTDRVGYPVGAAVALMDINPLLAVLLKPVSAFLPHPFQYLGIEIVLCFILQMFFALRLFRAVLGADTLIAIVPSLYFLIAPPMALRAVSHYALANQWVLTAALYVFVRGNSTRFLQRRRFALMAVVLTCIAVAINPYLAFQVLLVLVAAVASSLYCRKMSVASGVGLLGALGIASITTASILGFVMHGGKAYAAGGYRSYSMNLLSPIDPGAYGSLFLRQLQILPGQYEGYAYLGAGVVLLAFIEIALLAVWVRRLPRLEWRATGPLLVCFLVLTMMALSTRITFATTVLVDIDPKGHLTPYLSFLRSSGRLFWTPYYALLAAIVGAPYLLLKRKWAAATLVGGALILQLADLGPFRSWAYAGVNRVSSGPLRSPVWFKLGRSYQNLMVMPPWQCGAEASPGGIDGFNIFGMLAVSQRLRINSYNSGRYPDQTFHCITSVAMFEQGHVMADSVYVTVPALAEHVVSSGAARCHNVDGFVLCAAANDFGLQPEQWQSPTVSWIRYRYQAILLRDPTSSELTKWTLALDEHKRSRADLITDLLESAEFQGRCLPQFWKYVDFAGRVPTRIEWLSGKQPGKDGRIASTLGGLDEENGHRLHDRRAAVVRILYFAVLERDPDRAGASVWYRDLARTPLHDVVTGFLESPEYRAYH